MDAYVGRARGCVDAIAEQKVFLVEVNMTRNVDSFGFVVYSLARFVLQVVT